MTDTISLEHLHVLPSKSSLVAEFRGKTLQQLRTPAFVIDRAVFARNCACMQEKAIQWGARFRAHLKTHKTAEGTRLQLITSSGRTHAVVVSTLMEARELIAIGLVREGTVKDILYGLPIGTNKIAEFSTMWEEISLDGGIIRLLIDHIDQVIALEAYEAERKSPRRWSVFVKIDGGQKRAGVAPHSPEFKLLVKKLLSSPAISLYGFYCHAGNSYGSTSLNEASSFLSSEVEAVNTAAGLALGILSELSDNARRDKPFILSVGSTPTAHAASAVARSHLTSLLHGTLELHAGNYPMLDLQQLHTGLVEPDRVAHRVLATVISYYPGRGKDGEDEALCDAGALAMSKDTGPAGGFGEIFGTPWQLGRLSQEHGILTRSDGVPAELRAADQLRVGSQVQIVGQHACLTAAAFPWYYVVDSDLESGRDKVEDVWVPWKGW